MPELDKKAQQEKNKQYLLYFARAMAPYVDELKSAIKNANQCDSDKNILCEIRNDALGKCLIEWANTFRNKSELKNNIGYCFCKKGKGDQCLHKFECLDKYEFVVNKEKFSKFLAIVPALLQRGNSLPPTVPSLNNAETLKRLRVIPPIDETPAKQQKITNEKPQKTTSNLSELLAKYRVSLASDGVFKPVERPSQNIQLPQPQENIREKNSVVVAPTPVVNKSVASEETQQLSATNNETQAEVTIAYPSTSTLPRFIFERSNSVGELVIDESDVDESTYDNNGHYNSP